MRHEPVGVPHTTSRIDLDKYHSLSCACKDCLAVDYAMAGQWSFSDWRASSRQSHAEGLSV